MTATTGTVTADASGDSNAHEKVFDQIIADAVAYGWTELKSHPSIHEGFKMHSGRLRYNSPHRFWRFRLWGPQSMRIAQLELFDHAGAVIDISAASLQGSSTYTASYGIDNVKTAAGYWRTNSSSGSTSGHWIEVDFQGGPGQTRREAVGSARITQGTTSPATDLDVEWSEDGSEWFSPYENRLSVDGGDPSPMLPGLPTSGNFTYQLDYVGTANEGRPLVGFGRFSYLRGPGGGAGREVYVILSAYESVTSNYRGLSVRFATGFDNDAPPESQPGAATVEGFVPLDRDEVEYWHYINDRRILGQYRSVSAYNGLYAGMYVPFALPSEFDYPCISLGSYSSKVEVADANSAHRNVFDPGVGNGSLLLWDGSEKTIGNHEISPDVNHPRFVTTIQNIFVWPWGWGSAADYSFPTCWVGSDHGNASGHWLEAVDRTAQDELPIFPAILNLTVGEGKAVFGTLDGIFAVPGNSLVPEQAVTVGGRNFRAFPNHTRRNGSHYALIEEV